MMKRCLAALLFLATMVAVMVPVLAHHGFTGRYDLSAPIWLEGSVTEVYFGQPHPEITLQTDDELSLPTGELDLAGARDTIDIGLLSVRPDTRSRAVTVQFPPVAVFFELGSSVSVGDRIAIIAFRNCGEPHQLRGQWLRLNTAEPVARPGRVSYQVDGC